MFTTGSKWTVHAQLREHPNIQCVGTGALNLFWTCKDLFFTNHCRAHWKEVARTSRLTHAPSSIHEWESEQHDAICMVPGTVLTRHRVGCRKGNGKGSINGGVVVVVVLMVEVVMAGSFRH